MGNVDVDSCGSHIGGRALWYKVLRA